MPGPTGFSPLPTIRQTVNAKATQKAHLILRPRRLARPVLILLLIPTVLPRYGPADTRASQEVQHSWTALFFNKELGYLDLPFPLLGPLPGLCPQDGLLRFPLLAALEQMLARLLNSAVAPPTGVAGAADLLEVRLDEGVPRPELVEARGYRFASFWPALGLAHPLPWSVRVGQVEHRTRTGYRSRCRAEYRTEPLRLFIVNNIDEDLTYCEYLCVNTHFVARN